MAFMSRVVGIKLHWFMIGERDMSTMINYTKLWGHIE